MSENNWGLLGPEFLTKTRRIRTLGLGATVRLFNDRAVPGLGGVWYAKQLMLATLGIALAEDTSKEVSNIEMANAIEALACWTAFKNTGWKKDPRLRGNTKLKRNDDDFSFARVRKRSFYVTQPMRMATVQALPALGLVDAVGTRFNAFQRSDAGKAFVEQACKRSVINQLLQWVVRDKNDSKKVDTPAVCSALSPLVKLSDEALKLVRERLRQGGHENSEDTKRRGNALDWVEEIRQNSEQTGWAEKPRCIEEAHWQDLVAGAKFFSVRDAAIAVLDAMEAYIGNKAEGQIFNLQTAIPEVFAPFLAALKTAATTFLDTNHSDENAVVFCRECAQEKSSEVLRSLILRDGHVLRLVDESIKPGPSFRRNLLSNSKSEEEDDDDDEDEDGSEAGARVQGQIPLPEGISYRMRNLYLLNLDLHGELSSWLNTSANGDGA